MTGFWPISVSRAAKSAPSSGAERGTSARSTTPSPGHGPVIIFARKKQRTPTLDAPAASGPESPAPVDGFNALALLVQETRNNQAGGVPGKLGKGPRKPQKRAR